VLIGYYVVFIFRVDGLQMRRDVYFFWAELGGGEVGELLE
jgi:hypothetical protein